MHVAMVTGAGRGVGRGVAEGLAEAGAAVYFTARSRDQLNEVAQSVEALGGHPHPILFDHDSSAGLTELFERIRSEQGRLDLLVNNVWGGYERMIEGDRFTWMDPFWRQPEWRWDAMMSVGVRTAYIASGLAARIMLEAKAGLIVNISYWSAQKHVANVVYGIAKAATDKMSVDMAHELDGTGVAAISLYPGLVRTEKVMANAEYLDLSKSESPRYIGRVISALLADQDVLKLNGEICVAAEIGQRFGVVDVDGSYPRPLTLEEA